MTQRDLEKLFGLEFARRVMDLAPGAWNGPLPSAYGLHLVRVEEREPGRLPSLAALRNQVERAYRLEQGEVAYTAFLRRLRTKYGVEMAQGRSVSQPEAAPAAAGGAG
jgi:parvulin-like peptidyl-prolyl isomerase